MTGLTAIDDKFPATMPAKLCLLCCHNFHAEVAAGVKAEGWDDVITVAFTARCGRPPVNWDELRALLPADCGQVVVLGRSCLSHLGTAPPDWPATRVVSMQQCFHIVAGETLVDEAIAGGAYLITSVWLADWRGQIQAMGFAPEQVGEFFHDFARELVLLDTGLAPDVTRQLAELQAAVKLPARRIPVGLDQVRARLARLVLQWQLDELQHAAHAATQEQARRHASELADHVAAMDMLVQLAKTQHEADAIAAIEDLFRMLFAPAELHYLRMENGISTPRAPIPQAMSDALHQLSEDHAWTPDGQGFLLRINRGEETLGLIAVDRLAFSAYRERYLNLALAVTGVCGLAIENARNRKRLLEAEKMASLEILVAGVAHEINTPLGVGLAAASTLQARSRRLAEHFAARSMTQSDLTYYLDIADTSTGLICHNLERIGHLIEAFRQVAVEGKAQAKRAIRLRNCLSDVIRSFGERLDAERISMQVDCAEDLEIESVAGDWVSIFTNLIGDSLKHGFKGRARGVIDIHLACDTQRRRLLLDYRDDGVGLAPDTLAHVFDPFYTTDLQHGMGLGMHLVYNLVTHRMGGIIQCQSTAGNGVHFHIELPL
jgi:signal transduction histidine kinase